VAQTIEGFVGSALDEAKISPLHRKIVALIAAGYFFDVIDFTIFGSLVPYLLQSKFATGPEAAAIGSATIFGLFVGTAGQGQFSDRFGRRFIYQFNLLLFGIFTILGALAPSVTLLIICRFIAGVGLGAEQPLCFVYAGEYSPKRIRGRILAIVHFIGGACVWPIGTALVLLFGGMLDTPEHVWRGIWVAIGIGALIVWLLRFALPESPRYLATHGRGDEALGVLTRLGIAGPKEKLTTDVASNTKSDPFGVVFKMYPVRVVAGMICGLAGALLANHTEFVSPAMMHWTRSGDLIVMVVLGGMGSVVGPLIGAVALLVLEEALSGITEYWQIILGPMLLLVVLFARGGIDGLLAKIGAKVRL